MRGGGMSDALYRYEIPDCPLDTDGDGDCAMCARQPDFHRRLVEVPTAVVPWCSTHEQPMVEAEMCAIQLLAIAKSWEKCIMQRPCVRSSVLIVEGMAAAAETIVAAVGCPECGGTGNRSWVEGQQVSCNVSPCPHNGRCFPCSAEHVQLSILGETIWADPTKCVWWCSAIEDRPCPGPFAQACRSQKGVHEACGWRPRMDALFGEAE